MYPYEINVRLSELGALDYSSQIVRSACIEDLDPNEHIRLRKIIRISKEKSQLLELDDEELDKALCFVKSDGNKLYPTVAGLLMIGREDRLQSGNASFSAIQDTVHISVPRLKAVIGSLVSSGLAEECSGRYRLSPKAYKRERETLDYLQETEIDFHRAEDMVMKLARKKGEVTRSDVIFLLGIDPDQAYRILRKLVKKGYVELCGSGKGAKYRIGC